MNGCSECPALADVCEATRASMRDAVPTLSVRARTCDGAPLDATITIDGAPAHGGVALDPGRHDVHAELAGHVQEQTVFVSEGEHKNVSIVLGDPPRPAPLGVWVLTGVASAALLTAGTFWGVSASLGDSYSLASPYARDGYAIVDQTKRDYAVAAGVALAVSVTALVTAFVVYVTRPFPHPKGPD